VTVAELTTPAVESTSSTALPRPIPERPASVLTAGLVTILGSLAAAGFAVSYLGVYTFARDAYVAAVNTGPFKDMITNDELDLVMKVTLWVSIAMLPIASAGVLGGVALLARRPVGRTATLACSWAAALLGLVLFPLGLLATAAAGTVIVLLLRDDARAWTTGR